MSTSESIRHLLADLTQLPGVSGREDAVADYVRDRLQSICSPIDRDAMGNLICRLAPRSGAGARRAPRAPKVMLAAHTDEIGLLVQWIEESGALRVVPAGDVDPRNALGKRVVVHGRESLPGIVGTIPPHLTSPADREKLPPWADLFVDVGLPPETVKEWIRPGDAITFEGAITPLQSDRVASKALDNRAGLAAAVTALELLAGRDRQVEAILVGTSQEELGYRGATAAAQRVAPDVAIAIDVGFADMPTVSPRVAIQMGGGPSLSIGPNFHPQLGERILEIARARGIPCQTEVLPGNSGTDAWAIQVSGTGVPTALLSIPLRYMHSTVEVVSIHDIEATASILAAFCEALTIEEVRRWHGDRFAAQTE